jgi:hypothetical protein
MAVFKLCDKVTHPLDVEYFFVFVEFHEKGNPHDMMEWK